MSQSVSQAVVRQKRSQGDDYSHTKTSQPRRKYYSHVHIEVLGRSTNIPRDFSQLGPDLKSNSTS